MTKEGDSPVRENMKKAIAFNLEYHGAREIP